MINNRAEVICSKIYNRQSLINIGHLTGQIWVGGVLIIAARLVVDVTYSIIQNFWNEVLERLTAIQSCKIIAFHDCDRPVQFQFSQLKWAISTYINYIFLSSRISWIHWKQNHLRETFCSCISSRFAGILMSACAARSDWCALGETQQTTRCNSFNVQTAASESLSWCTDLQQWAWPPLLPRRVQI